jgi:hypothetical protein
VKSALESQVLCDFTDAHLFVMVDGLDGTAIADIWQESQRLSKTVSPEAGAAYARKEMTHFKADEGGHVAGFMSAALLSNRADRYTPLTLSALDVLDYVRVEKLVPDAESWDQLREACGKALSVTEVSGNKFKEWLRKARKVNLSNEAISAAAADSPLPDEFRQHLTTIASQLRET